MNNHTIHPMVGYNSDGMGVGHQWNVCLSGWVQRLQAAGLAAGTVRTRRAAVHVIAVNTPAPTPAEVDPDWLTGWCAAQSWSVDHRRTIRTSLRSFYAWCVDHGHANLNLGDQLPAVPESRPRPRPLPDDLYAALLAAASPAVALMARLAGEAGLRRAEVACVHHRDVTDDGVGPVLIVHGKGSRQRCVPITTSLAAAIAAHNPGGGFVFPGDDGGHVSPNWVGKQISALLPAGWSMHKLRHRFASRGYAGTRNLVAVRAALGHASLATTQRYVAVPDADVRAVSESAA